MRWLGLVLLVAACQRGGSSADCAAIADKLTTIELGKDVDVQTRAPTVARHRTECESARVTAAEAQCLDKAANTWAAAACVPRMFPKLQTGNASCDEVVVRIRQAAESQAEALGSGGLAMMEKMLPAMKAACEQDSWPASLRSCITSAPPGDAEAMGRCTQTMSPELQQRLSERMRAARGDAPAAGSGDAAAH